MVQSKSRLERLASLPPDVRARIIADFDPQTSKALAGDWSSKARPSQLSPWSPKRGSVTREQAIALYKFWVVRAGRGFGKTRCAAETVHEEARAGGDGYRIGLIARSAADVRDTMVELGDSSILGCAPPDFRPKYEPSKRRITWPNGAIATTFTGDEPDQLRGPQHHFVWADEIASWKKPQTWDMALYGLRLGSNPRAVITSTPRRMSPVLRSIEKGGRCFVSTGSTYDNAANLAADFLADIRARFEKTTQGREELYGEESTEVDGALWKRKMIDPFRLYTDKDPFAPQAMPRVVVAVDPPGGATECGIIAAGVGRSVQRAPTHAYVLADYSRKSGPDDWGRAAVMAFANHQADAIVAEKNYGGDMVPHVIKSAWAQLRQEGLRIPEPRIIVVAATRGKEIRAEPVVGKYEQGLVHHVDMLPQLESELTGWVPGEGPSPNRLDALVWAIWALLIEPGSKVSGVVDTPGLTMSNPFAM